MGETPEQQTELYRRMIFAESHAKEAKLQVGYMKRLVWVAVGLAILALNVAVVACGAVFLK